MRPDRSTPGSIRVGERVVELERVPCGNCGGELEEPLLEGPDRFLHLPGMFRLVRCPGCGLIRQNPRPTASSIDAYYPSEYEPYSRTLDEERNPLRRWDRWYGMYKRRRLIERYQPKGRLLDVGCATGNFLAVMARSGRWRVRGIEPNAAAAEVARQKLGLEVVTGRLGDADLEPESFDVVTLWNVLEHLHEPIEDLRRAARLLRPGGLLVFSVPNLESFEVRLFRERWFGWELPRHLYFFPKPALGEVLKATGFELLESTCLSGTQISFGSSLQYMFGNDERPAWNGLATALLASPPGRLWLFPVFYLLGALDQGMIITHVARKARAER